MNVSDRVSSISGSATLAINARAKALRAEGVDVVNFSAGEPDFDTPERIKSAGECAIRENRTRYTHVAGILELRREIAERLRADFGLSYSPERILVTTGAKQAVFAAVHALVDPGDEVIIPSPYWVSYPEQVKSAGGVPVLLHTEDTPDFRIDPDRFESLVTPRTRVLILNSPSNPTGRVYTRPELEAIGEVVVKHDLAVVADEIYALLVYCGEFVSFPALSDELKERTVLISGMSKTYCMTGWRIGWAAGPEEVIDGMTRLQEQSTSNPTTISQHASVEALRGDRSFLAEFVREFDRRRRRMVEGLEGLPGIECYPPQGAFYVFPRVKGCFGRTVAGRPVNDSFSFAEACLDEARVALVPGAPFGSDEHVRLSYATSMDEVEEGMSRIRRFVARMSP